MKQLLLALTFAASMAQAVIHETEKMQPAFDAVKTGTLLVFDLDNTLIETTQMVGSDQWYEHEVKTLVEARARAGEDPKLATVAAIKEVLPKWVEVQLVTEVKAVEPGVAEQIEKVQERGIRVLGLTARPPKLSNTTRLQLKSVGIDLSASPITSEVIVFDQDEAELRGGIYFIGPGRTKGTELVRLLDKLKARPAQIVFADDKRHHVESVEKALAQRGIPYHGFRYGMADPHVKAFDPLVAAQQFKYFGKILGDKEAKVLSDLEKAGMAE